MPRSRQLSPGQLELPFDSSALNPARDVPETVYAYLAGIIDADGTITCQKPQSNNHFDVAVRVHQAEREAVDLFVATFGGQVKMRRSYSEVSKRETFMWYTTVANRVEALTKLLPHLRQKREQAAFALEIIRLNQSWRGRSTHDRPAAVVEQLHLVREQLCTANDFGKRGTSVAPPEPPAVLPEAVPAEIAAYLAGVLDADGHLRLRRQDIKGCVRFPAEVKLKQVTAESIIVLQQYFGIKVRVEEPSLPNGRHLLNWSCAARTAERLLRVVEPFMLIKKMRAQLILESIAIQKEPWEKPVVPKVEPGEPLIPLAEAAERLELSYGGAAAAVRAGRVPFVKVKRQARGAPVIFVPESFLTHWKRHHARRPAALEAKLDELVAQCKKLNGRSAMGV